tara:strand:- start:897 stop:1067 length:171 start_codon:yes stop_codon:yes gene_type:complete
MNTYKILFYVYLATGIVLCVQGLMMADSKNILYSLGMYAMAMMMVAALIAAPEEKQ